MMWYEARKQEKIIRNVMVDVKKRAERRKDFYDKIKQDPIRFLRLYGSKSKVIIDPEIAVAAENPNTMMVWVGDGKTVIDRFDVRANLDHVDQRREYSLDADEKLQERMCNYERYRCLVHNQFGKIPETNALSKIETMEKYGEDLHKVEKNEQNKKKKQSNSEKAAIGYVYADSEYMHNPADSESSESLDSEPDLEMDLDIELDITHLSFQQQRELVKLSQLFGMRGNDYLKLMKVDKTQEEEFRTAKLLEEQKAQFHGRKSRRERKIFKEQRLKEKYLKQDPKTLSYGASVFHEEIYVGKDLLTPSPPRKSSHSRSPSPNAENSSRNKPIIVFGSTNTKLTNKPSLDDFVNLPTIRDDDSHRRHTRSRSPRRRRSSSPLRTSRYVTSSRKRRRRSSSTNSRSGSRSDSRYRSSRRHHNYSSISRRETTPTRNKRCSYRDNKDARRHYSGARRQSRSPDRPSRSSGHGYNLSQYKRRDSSAKKDLLFKSRVDSKSPEIPEEVVLKKKYYRSESEADSSSTFASSSSSRSDSDEDNEAGRMRQSYIKKQEPRESNYLSSIPSAASTSSVQPSSTNKATTAHKIDLLSSKFNPQEFLKKQMEIQLNRAYKADKKAEQEKLQKVEKERMARENQLKEMSQQIKRREWEKKKRDDPIGLGAKDAGYHGNYDDDNENGSMTSSMSSQSSRSPRHRPRVQDSPRMLILRGAAIPPPSQTGGVSNNSLYGASRREGDEPGVRRHYRR